MVTLHVSNLPFEQTAEDLTTLFAGYGDVRRVTLPMDQASGRPRGFAFIEMADEVGAAAAIDALHQSSLGGRSLKVGRARARG